MSLNSNEIFSRLLKLFKTQKMNELSVFLGYKESWGAATRKRGGIPFEACVIATEKFDITMDYLLFGEKKNDSKQDIDQLRGSITDSIYELIDSGIITKNEKIGISFITEHIMQKLKNET